MTIVLPNEFYLVIAKPCTTNHVKTNKYLKREAGIGIGIAVLDPFTIPKP